MPKENNVKSYISELKKMIKSRTGVDCESWLIPQVRTTAMNMVILDKIQDELDKSDITYFERGSMGQKKLTLHPLLATYKDMQRTLLLQFEALGLNYKTTPSKVNEPTKKGGSEHDKLAGLLQDITNI